MVSGPDVIIPKLVSSATETSEEIETSLVIRLYMLLSNKRIAKALISLRGGEAGLRLCYSQNPKTGFLASKPN